MSELKCYSVYMHINKINGRIFVSAAQNNNVSERSVSDCCNNHIKSVKRLVFAFCEGGDT